MRNRRDTFEHVANEINSLVDARVAIMRGETVLAASDRGGSPGVDPVLIPWNFNHDQLLVAVRPDQPLPQHLVEGVVRLVIQQLTVTNNISDWARSKDRFIADLLCGPVPEHYDIARLSDVLRDDSCCADEGDTRERGGEL